MATTNIIVGQAVTAGRGKNVTQDIEIIGLTAENNTAVIPKGYHDGTGAAKLTDDIYDALAAI